MENLEHKLANYNKSQTDHWDWLNNAIQDIGDVAALSISQPFNTLGIDVGQDKLYSTSSRAAAAKQIQGVVGQIALKAVGITIPKVAPTVAPTKSPVPISVTPTLSVSSPNMVIIVGAVLLIIILIAS
jgi:hypothetical protein